MTHKPDPLCWETKHFTGKIIAELHEKPNIRANGIFHTKISAISSDLLVLAFVCHCISGSNGSKRVTAGQQLADLGRRNTPSRNNTFKKDRSSGNRADDLLRVLC